MKTLVFCSVLLCMAGLALSLGEPSCKELLSSIKKTLYFNLPKSTSFDELVEYKCLSKNNRIRKLYTCKEDAKAVLIDSNGNEVDTSSSKTVNVQRQQLQCESLSTTPPPLSQLVEERIEDLEELPDVELPSEPEATAPPSTETEKPSVQSTACPSLTLSRSRISGSVCGKQCTFYTSVYGARQERTRTYYTCCSGDAPQRHRSIPNYYTCPKTEETERPPVRVTPPVSRATLPPTTEIERPSVQSSTCPSSSKRILSSTRSGKVCQGTCTFTTNVHGAIRERTRNYSFCCSGAAPRPYFSLPNYYVCPP